MDKWRNSIKSIKQGTDFKEKEIVRLSFLAEQDKKTGMFLSQQVARKHYTHIYEEHPKFLFVELKKSLEGFIQAHEESKPETLCTVSIFSCIDNT